MAITYKWDIPQMNAHIEAEGEDNVIYTVHWRYTGSEESEGKDYSSTQIGTQSYTYVAGTPFVIKDIKATLLEPITNGIDKSRPPNRATNV